MEAEENVKLVAAQIESLLGSEFLDVDLVALIEILSSCEVVFPNGLVVNDYSRRGSPMGREDAAMVCALLRHEPDHIKYKTMFDAKSSLFALEAQRTADQKMMKWLRAAGVVVKRSY